MFDSTAKFTSLGQLESKLEGTLQDLLQETIKRPILTTNEVKVSVVIPMQASGSTFEQHYLVEFMREGKYTSRKVTFPSEVESLIEAILTQEDKAELVTPY